MLKTALAVKINEKNLQEYRNRGYSPVEVVLPDILLDNIESPEVAEVEDNTPVADPVEVKKPKADKPKKE